MREFPPTDLASEVLHVHVVWLPEVGLDYRLSVSAHAANHAFVDSKGSRPALQTVLEHNSSDKGPLVLSYCFDVAGVVTKVNDSFICVFGPVAQDAFLVSFANRLGLVGQVFLNPRGRPQTIVRGIRAV